jgi:hypothetical protein
MRLVRNGYLTRPRSLAYVSVRHPQAFLPAMSDSAPRLSNGRSQPDLSVIIRRCPRVHLSARVPVSRGRAGVDGPDASAGVSRDVAIAARSDRPPHAGASRPAASPGGRVPRVKQRSHPFGIGDGVDQRHGASSHERTRYLGMSPGGEIAVSMAGLHRLR